MDIQFAPSPVEIVLAAMTAVGIPTTSTTVHVLADELMQRGVEFPVLQKES